MAHFRQLFRDEITAFLTGATLAGANVSTNRSRPFDKDALPAIKIITPAEQKQSRTQITDARTMDVVVLLCAHADAADVDDKLDTMAAEVEEAFFAHTWLTDGAIGLEGPQMEMKAPPEGAHEFAMMELTFQLQYQTPSGKAQP